MSISHWYRGFSKDLHIYSGLDSPSIAHRIGKSRLATWVESWWRPTALLKSARTLCPCFVVLLLTSGAKSGCAPKKRWQLSWHTVAWASHQGATAHLPETSKRWFTKKSLFKNSQRSGRSSRNCTFVQFPRRSWVSVHTSKTTWRILIFFFFFFNQMRELKNGQQHDWVNKHTATGRESFLLF